MTHQPVGIKSFINMEGVSQDDPSITGESLRPSHSIITPAAIYTGSLCLLMVHHFLHSVRLLIIHLL